MLTPASAPDPVDSPHAADAEEVRAHFVALRGGAPFLSSADGVLLLDWLEAGVPVARILLAVELTAQRRRARRARRPFTLRECARALSTSATSARPPRESPPPVRPDPAPLGPDPAPVIAAIAALPQGEPEARARAACALARAFHESAWIALGEAREVLLTEAAAELPGLAEVLGQDAFAAMCEEIARDRVRARYPELTASHIWQEFGRGVD